MICLDIETTQGISYIYKNRWQIETFFKWIKQNLVIKKLWGHSQNGVKIHIWIAIYTYLIVTYVKKSMKRSCQPIGLYKF